MEILILAFLILLNGFFALSEIALISCKLSRLEQKRLQGSKGAAVALKLLGDSEHFLSAVQVGITLIGIVTGMYGGISIADDIAPLLQRIDLLRPFAGELALVLTVMLITYVSIVIGELVPKSMALSNPESIAVLVARPMQYFSSAFYPFVRLLSISTSAITALVGLKEGQKQVTEEELRQMLRIASKEGVIEREQNILHEKVFYFSDKKARHIMTHRTDVEWVDLEKSQDELIQSLFRTKHSKIICARRKLDNLEGILLVKDVFRALYSGVQPDFRSLLVKPLIVPDATEAQKVLATMREHQTHICCVVDEYGGLAGIITTHDIVEHIVGQLPDEGDPYEPDIFVRDDKSVLVSGDAPIEALKDIIEDFEIDFEDIAYSSVAGFVFHRLDKIPQTGDVFEYMGYRVEIVDMDRNKVDKILLTKIIDTGDDGNE